MKKGVFESVFPVKIIKKRKIGDVKFSNNFGYKNNNLLLLMVNS